MFSFLIFPLVIIPQFMLYPSSLTLPRIMKNISLNNRQTMWHVNISKRSTNGLLNTFLIFHKSSQHIVVNKYWHKYMWWHQTPADFITSPPSLLFFLHMLQLSWNKTNHSPHCPSDSICCQIFLAVCLKRGFFQNLHPTP